MTDDAGTKEVSTFAFDRETEVKALDQAGSELHHFRNRVDGSWNIGDNPNGGYALSAALRAMAEVSGRPDPLTVTTHFLRPSLGDTDATLHVEAVRAGRRSATLSATMDQSDADGMTKERLRMVAAFGDLANADSGWAVAPDMGSEPVELPAPDDCRPRIKLEQGINLPILSRLDVRIDPIWAEPGVGGRAEVSGWIRFTDGRPPDSMSLPLFADAFPPSLFSLFGRVGWVPTLELTVHVRRRPVDGWIRARFRTEDLTGGTFIENGELWDADGQLVAQSRQLGVLLSDGR